MHFFQTVFAFCILALTTATPLLHPPPPESLSDSPSTDERKPVRLHHFDNPSQKISPHNHLEARDGLQLQGKLGGMYMCTGSSWSGSCKYIQPAMTTCSGLPPGFELNISSFSPDQVLGGAVPQFAFGCRLYEGEGCSGANVRFAYPGVSAGPLWVSPRSARCEFYSPAAAKWFEFWGDKSTYGK